MGPRINGVFDDPCDDETPCPFKPHKGVRLAEVPGGFLLWLEGQENFRDTNPGLAAYIDEHRVRLEDDKKAESAAYHRNKKIDVTVVNFDED